MDFDEQLNLNGKYYTMLTNKILTADLIDIIFDGRNKEYGAYELRKTYSNRIGKALMATAVLVALAIGGVVLANTQKKSTTRMKIGPEVIISDVDLKQPEKIKEPEPERKQVKQQVKEIAFTEPKLVDKDKIETPPPTIDEVNTAKISDKNIVGIEATDVPEAGPQNPSNGTGIIGDKPEKEPAIFEPIEIAASFSGNWVRFLEQNLNAETPISNGAPAGRYSVMIKFTIDENGNIISTEPLTHHGYGMEVEAIRVIKKASSKWQAPIQNGYKQKATMKQVITFVVQDEEG